MEKGKRKYKHLYFDDKDPNKAYYNLITEEDMKSWPASIRKWVIDTNDDRSILQILKDHNATLKP